MIKKKNKNNFNPRKAQVLLIVIVLLFIAGILAGGVAAIFTSEVKILPLSEQGMRAFYLAQAGLEEAKAEIKWLEADNDDFNSGGWVTDLYPAAGNFIFQYDYDVDPGTNADEREIIATGQVLDAGDNVIASRTLRVMVSGVDDGLVAPDGEDDDGNVEQKAWTWREM